MTIPAMRATQPEPMGGPKVAAAVRALAVRGDNGATAPNSRTHGRIRWVRLLAVALVLAMVAPLVQAGPAVDGARRGDRGAVDKAPTNLTIVILRDGADPATAARALGVKPVYLYESVFSGFAAELPAAAATASRKSGTVAQIVPDEPVAAASQVVPTGVARVGATPTLEKSGKKSKNRKARGLDVDVAVLDTGIAKHPDLRVQPGKACVGKKPTKDRDGHGTHVAGIIGARNNDIGVVGVAPGARLWPVKVLDSKGLGTRATAICGLDWVHKNRATIDVVNMSVSGPGEPGACNDNPFHRAICRVVGAGIPVIVAAGNSNEPASQHIPAAWPETITVSSFADTDGKPGGVGPPSCNEDDRRSWFSNYGPEVDIAAPGECIYSTYRRNKYTTIGGTSQAAPHVAGAVARYKATNPRASPLEVRIWLLTEASRPQNSPEGITGDNDGSFEPVLYLGS